MKRILVTSFLLILLLGVKGQSPINVGLKFGMNYSSLITSFDEVFDKSQITHYHAGAFIRFSLDKVYLQPEVYFNTKGGIIDEFNALYIDEYDYSEQFSYQTIDIPILLGFHIVNKPIFNLRVYGGPVLSYVTTDPIINDFSDLNVEELKDNFIGAQIGVGFDLWFVTIDARVENTFNIFIESSEYSAANQVYLISAGIKLF
ncbi:MAG: PorT family protein [Prolixibacteraceae bacterium]|nr:PorT family protein [Prolixibacteraceae bacterium]